MMNNEKRAADADAKLAKLLYSGPIALLGSVVQHIDSDWGPVHTPRWTMDNGTSGNLQRKYRVCINYYEGHVTANVMGEDGAKVRYSQHDSDDEALRFAIVAAVTMHLEKKA